MKKAIVSAVSIVLLAAMLLCMVSCEGQKKEIKDLMSRFEYACNTLDFNSVLDCINPKVAEGIKIGAGLVGLFTKMDSEELFDKLSEVLLNEDLGGADFFSSIEIDVNKITMHESTATVSTLVKYGSGTKTEKAATFECSYYSEKWYITGMSFDEQS